MISGKRSQYGRDLKIMSEEKIKEWLEKEKKDLEELKFEISQTPMQANSYNIRVAQLVCTVLTLEEILK
jgi:hypothetical protein